MTLLQLKRIRQELIETLWNVNIIKFLASALLVPELIETLWNVNLSDKSTLAVRSTRINRNIVECKFDFWDSLCATPATELIETLWNVNPNACEMLSVTYLN